MPSQLPFTALLNCLLHGPVSALLTQLDLPPKHPLTPIPDYVAMQVLVFLLLVIFFAAVRARLSVEKPGGLQHVMESIHGFIDQQSREMIGHGNKPFVSYLITLGLFILCCNVLGLFPFLDTPTGNPRVPLGCAVITWFYYHFQGIRAKGFGYIKNFLGPMWWLAWLLFPIEVVSHLARMVSLTIRLYANMFVGDMVTLVFFSMVPVVVPAGFMGFHLFVAFIQTYIFILLAMVYLGEAVSHEH